jgi:hypothetical protein
MEPLTQNSSLFQLNIDANVGMSLRGAASWAKVLGILGIIFAILFIAVGILVQSAINSASPYDGFEGYSPRTSTSTIANFGMAMYIGMGVLTLIGSIFALNFGSKASTAIRANDGNSLRSSFNQLRNYFAFWSILMILGLLLTIIGIAGGAMSNM